MPRSLELVVTAVATRLIAVDAATATGVSQQVLAELVTYFDVDFSFLRHNDHDIHATRLIAEWPPRTPEVQPDPLQLVYFADADPVFALAEHLKEPAVFRPGATEEYQRTISDSRRLPTTTMACVPLLSGDVTTGVIGFVKTGDREWNAEELNALAAIASLFAQVQARVYAEERRRFLAEHDDLTGNHTGEYRAARRNEDSKTHGNRAIAQHVRHGRECAGW